MDNKKEKDIRYVEERIRKIDGFLLAVNSKIEKILEENDNHPRVSVVFGSKILDISLYTDTVAALQDLICAEKKVWEEVLSGLKDG